MFQLRIPSVGVSMMSCAWRAACAGRAATSFFIRWSGVGPPHGRAARVPTNAAARSTAADLVRTQGSSRSARRLSNALSRLGDVEPSPVGLPKPPPVPPPLPVVVEDEAPVVDAPRRRRLQHRLQPRSPRHHRPPRPHPRRPSRRRRRGAPEPEPEPEPEPKSEPPKSPSQKSRARTPSPARKARKKGKKKRAKKEAAEVPVEATEQHLLTIVVGDDELGGRRRGVARARGRHGVMRPHPRPTTTTAPTVGHVEIRGARGARPPAACASSSARPSARATAHGGFNVARRRALFTSACVVRCGSDDAAARATPGSLYVNRVARGRRRRSSRADLHTIAAEICPSDAGPLPRVPAGRGSALIQRRWRRRAAPRSFE